MRLTRRRKQGFTLIELMVVIAIIAALAALLLPVIANMIEDARMNACKANLKAHGTAFFSYKDKNQGKLPVLYVAGNPGQKLGSPVTGTNTSWGTADASFNDSNTTTHDEMLSALGTNAMQNMWLLIDGGFIGGGEQAYKCPNDQKWAARAVGSLKFGWTSAYNFSYSIQFPYGGTTEIAAQSGTGKVLPGADSDPPSPDNTWNWGNPNGTISVASGGYSGKAMYPENCILMADRNTREASSDGGTSDGGWAAVPGDFNHKGAICYLEKGATNGLAPTDDVTMAQVGMGRDDIYTNRQKSGGLPYVDPSTGFEGKFAKAPCTDTVLWPLSERSLERSGK
ncbi:MAG: prepilin-type N-terminal cleavage/methylation domain-containing protein [Planctomycetota bacterium]|nr:prepilin-type N-terminal cleavage/methylation domain-containing protein [Planctomycetota bacterium]